MQIKVHLVILYCISTIMCEKLISLNTQLVFGTMGKDCSLQHLILLRMLKRFKMLHQSKFYFVTLINLNESPLRSRFETIYYPGDHIVI